jgi:hypothetical protein
LNQPIIVPIIHRDDYAMAASVFDDERLAASLKKDVECLVVYAPKRVVGKGLSGTPDHCLHYAICPRGTLEHYYRDDSTGDRRMARPTPEVLVGPLVYKGNISVRVVDKAVL